ncbi:MAG: amino acid ABC transporter permease [Candidatus Limnocylindrales bacterium]
MGVLVSSLPDLAQGAIITAQVTFEAILLAAVLAVVLVAMRLSGFRVLDWSARAYIWFWRGVPLIIELYLIYFGLATANIITLSPWVSAILGLGLNTAAFFAEIMRAAILSIDKEQWEAGDMESRRSVTLALVIFPQASARMVPPLMNQIIMSLKNSSLVAFVGVTELFMVGQNVISSTFQDLPIYIGVAGGYLVMVTLLTFLGDYAERHLLVLA